jgi:hypothetical protein
MSEAEFDVDAAEAEYNASREAGADGGGDEPGDGDRGGDQGGDPPGFKTYDEYIADGGDPDMYRGKKAFEAEHTRIDENKRLRKDVRGLQDTVQQTMEAVTDWQTVERGKMRKELDAQLKKNREDEDLDGALATQKEIDELDDEPEPGPAPTEEHSVIQDFRDANPMLDADHDDFDQDFNDDVEAFYNGLYQQLSYGGRKKVSDGQIKRALKRALKEANELHEIEAPGQGQGDEPGESRRNNRRGRQQNRSNRRAGSQRTSTPKAEEFVIDNPRNARQANAAPEVRDMIRDKAFQQAKKSGKDDAAANKSADEAAHRFEESLAR